MVMTMMKVIHDGMMKMAGLIHEQIRQMTKMIGNMYFLIQ